MREFDRVARRASRVFRREPWWAEFWSAVTAIAWAGMSWGSGNELDAWPSMRVLLRIGDEGFWHAAGFGLGALQLAFLLGNRRWLRWGGAMAMGWFWAVLTLGVSVAGAPGVAVYAGWCGINVFSVLRLLRHHGR